MPLSPFHAAVLASMQAPPENTLDIPADTITPTSAKMAPPPAVYNAPPTQEWAPSDPLAGVVKVIPGDPLTDPKMRLPDPPAPIGPPPPPANVNAAPAGPVPLQPGEHPMALVSGGGVIPAHEVDLRGPSLKNAQNAVEDTTGQTIQANTANTQEQAQAEYAMYLDQERSARAREAAWQQSQAEREEEMQQRQADFDQGVKALSQTAIDPNRFWATRSTGQKVSAMISLALGGFLQGARGGSNPGMDIINTAIERDVRAQETQYHAARDVVNARQTAFALAAQKYQNADAARAMARAAAIDTVQAQMAQNAALWKGTEAANRANSAIAALQQEKMGWIAQGIKFVQPQAAQRLWRSPNGVTYNEAQMRDFEKELRGYEQGRELVGLNAAGAIQKEMVAGQMKQGEKADEGARHIATQLLTAGVPQARSAAEAALAALNASPGGLKETAVRGALPETLGNRVMGDDANAREQAYQTYSNQVMKALMGNVTAGEEVRARKMLGSASDPESRRRAIAASLTMLDEVEKNAKAGESPAAQEKFEQGREAAKGNKALVPKGAATGGWK